MLLVNNFLTEFLTEKLSRLLNEQEHLVKMSKAAKRMISKWSYAQTFQQMIMAIKG